jgi:hypothetical protein
MYNPLQVVITFSKNGLPDVSTERYSAQSQQCALSVAVWEAEGKSGGLLALRWHRAMMYDVVYHPCGSRLLAITVRTPVS